MPQVSNSFVSWFEDIGLSDRPSVGGKGASLGELTGAGIQVPPGFVITTVAFEKFLAGIDAQGSIRDAVKGLDPEDLDRVTATGARLQSQITDADLPDDIRVAVVAAYATLCDSDGDVAVAVRSSATSEDSEEASFAGLQETYLWVSGADNVLRRVLECWASLYCTESITYRRRLGLPEDNLAMGVVIQRMVNSRVSGVMFTRSPTTGDRSVITIESSWGLGSSIVSGEVTPDKFVIGKVTGEVTGRDVSQKDLQHVRDVVAGGVQEEEVPQDKRNEASISDEQIGELVQVAKRIEQHYGCPQDIEWAIAEDDAGKATIYLLQSRPETVWANKTTKPIVAPKATAFGHVMSVLSGGRG